MHIEFEKELRLQLSEWLCIAAQQRNPDAYEQVLFNWLHLCECDFAKTVVDDIRARQLTRPQIVNLLIKFMKARIEIKNGR